MNLLIIDNGTTYLPQLKKLLSQHTLKISKYSELNSINREDYDATILSGGHDFPVCGNEEKLRQEISFIKNSTKPIFGICFGFELIAHTFGAKLVLMPFKERGILDIEILSPDEIFINISNFQVYESHRWVIKEPTTDVSVLARSKDGIEAIRHITNPIYGVQFHPEIFVDKTCGARMLANFLQLVDRRNK